MHTLAGTRLLDAENISPGDAPSLGDLNTQSNHSCNKFALKRNPFASTSGYWYRNDILQESSRKTIVALSAMAPAFPV